jgi:PTH2 family peptidyl-tRNA hydrolase
MADPQEVVMYLVARADLHMSPGKLAAQVGHGVQYALELVKRQEDPSFQTWHEEWAAKSSTKIILAVGSQNELSDLVRNLSIPAALVVDEGRTEIAAASQTVVALVPVPRFKAKPFVGHLKRYH